MVFFIEKKKNDSDQATSVFISKIENDLETITTAKSGNVEFKEADKFLSLQSGQQTILNHKTGEVRLTEFESFKFLLDPTNRQILTRLQSQMLSTLELLNSSERVNRGELFWRLGLFLAAINLALLAVQLASVNPRVGRSYSLAMAMLCFVGYYNMLTIGKRLIADGTATFGGMMITVHGTATLIVVVWYLHTEYNLHWRRFVAPAKTQHP
jgi:lipopolysaccharide export system permease protein